MADLIASSRDGSQRWRRPLPDAPVKLGKQPGPDGWAVPWDGYVSAFHATLLWQDGKLHVRRRIDPPTKNPIYFHGQPADEFDLAPGEQFAIGETVFTLEEAAPAEVTIGREELKGVRYVDADRRLEALAALPEVIRYSPSDSDLEHRVLQVLLDGLPHARAAAVVQFLRDQSQPPNDLKIAVRAGLGRSGVAEVRPSRRLVYNAIVRDRKCVGHIWMPGLGGSGELTLSDPRTDWAICAPLPDEPASDWGLYVEGQLPRLLRPTAGGVPDASLGADIKFLFLTAEIFGALRQVRDLRERKAQLSSFLSPAVLRAVDGRNMDAVLERREAPVTVLFCDLRGFSRRCDQGEADLTRLWDLVSEALGVMTTFIIEYEGVIGDFQGDSALGFWGWPFEQPDQVERAARAALAIRRKVAQMAANPRHPLADFACGIGLAHGTAIAGRIGTPDQFKVGVFGPPVNLAARLEGMTKRFRVPIVADEAVLQVLNRSEHRPWVRCRRLAKVRPYGMERVVGIGELLPPAVEPGALPEPARLNFEAAARAFEEGRWNEAGQMLRWMSDGPSEFLKDYMARHPDGPADDWQGEVALDTK